MLVGLESQRKMLKSCVTAGKPAVLIGDTGTGKTSLVKELAAEMGLEVMRVNLNGGTTPDKLEGRFQLDGKRTYFQYGVVPEAMRDGKLLLLDELNAALPDTLFTLHPLLEEQPRFFVPDTGEEFTPHENFRVVATMNPTHDYAGTRQLNMALYSRFGAVIRFDTPRGKQLLDIVVEHHPKADAEVITRVVDVVDKMVELRQQELINTPIGVREALAAVTFASDGLTLKEAVVAAVGNKLEPSERSAAKEIRILGESAVKSIQSIGELLQLAKDAQKYKRENARLVKRMSEYDKLKQALKDAGCTPKELEELEADEASDVSA